MVAGDCVSRPVGIAPLDNRIAIGVDAEEDSPPVAIEEEQIPKGLQFPGQVQVLRLARMAVQDQVGEDPLLLLPEILGVRPGELERHAVVRVPLDGVENAAADLVHAQVRHAVRQPA